MKDKIRRILDLIRAGRLTLDDAAPLLAALHTRLALQITDRELLAALLNREELTADQIAEQLMLLRGVRGVRHAAQQHQLIGDLVGGQFLAVHQRGQQFAVGDLEGQPGVQ
ncbi:hypothetical protein K5D85_19630, partial [Deinococcus sp. RIT780]|nr:hypothetical protein [Deinococcus sp. RIT780]